MNSVPGRKYGHVNSFFTWLTFVTLASLIIFSLDVYIAVGDTILSDILFFYMWLLFLLFGFIAGVMHIYRVVVLRVNLLGKKTVCYYAGCLNNASEIRHPHCGDMIFFGSCPKHYRDAVDVLTKVEN